MPPPLIHRRRAGAAIALAALALARPSLSFGQDYPAKPVTIVVPFPPGGGTDVVFRVLSAKLQTVLGVPVIVDNRAGAGGTIGTAAAAKAPADGYTLIGATTTTIASAQAVYPKLGYDPQRDLLPISLVGTTPFVLVTPADFPAKTVADLVRHAGQHKGSLNYGSIGNGSASHLVAELFKQRTGIEMTHVPYRGAGPAQTGLMSGEVQVLFDNPTALVQQVRAGRMQALAITEASTVFPGLPTFAAGGVKDFKAELWYGLLAPAATPQAVARRIHEALRQVLDDPAVKADFLSRGVAISPSGPEPFAQKIRGDIALWGGIAKAVGARVE